jgi:septum formation protein
MMMGRSGVLRTGHWLIDPDAGRAIGEVAHTTVHMGHLNEAEMDAYLDTGEPFHVAGGFTLDALGGAFVEGVEGDPSNVVGLSLPTLRRLLAEMGITWTDLWDARR